MEEAFSTIKMWENISAVLGSKSAVDRKMNFIRGGIKNEVQIKEKDGKEGFEREGDSDEKRIF